MYGLWQTYQGSYSVCKKTWVLTCYSKITELRVCFMTCHGNFKFGIKSLTAVDSNYIVMYCMIVSLLY